jgi:hypothetical protein
MSNTKKLKREERQKELLSYFTEDHYQEKKVGDEWYIKMWNGGTNKWQVAVFSDKSYKKYKSYQTMREEVDDMDNEVQEKIDFERPTLESIQRDLQNG